MSVELWKSICDWSAVILVGLTFIAGFGALVTGRIIGDRQDDRLRQFDRELTASKTAQSAQEERAAIAEGNIALAGQHAKEADAKAEGFRLAIAKAGENAAKAQASLADANKRAAEADAKAESFRLDIAKAQEQAASANLTAEQERSARLQLEAKLADRVLTPDQKRRITEVFGPMKGQTLDVVIVGDTPEVSRIDNAILGCIRSAGVMFNFFHPFSGGGAQGVALGVRTDAPEEDRQAGAQFVAILRETLDGGVGIADFDKIPVDGTGAVSSTAGAAPVGKSALRLQIAPK